MREQTTPVGPVSVPVTKPPRVPYYLTYSTLRRFTVDEYHRMISAGILVEGEPYQLLEGYIVRKVSRSTNHDAALQSIVKRLTRVLGHGWDVRGKLAVTMSDGNEPEPDVTVVRGDEKVYRHRHPGPADIGLVIEIADSSLLIDRHDKGSIYARANLPVYWVVNVVDRVIEVYSQPAGTDETAAYARRDDFPVGTAVPVVLDGVTVGTVAVADVMG